MKCELCGSEKSQIIATEIREGPGIICRCSSCGLIFQDISQTMGELREYYNIEYQKTNSFDFEREQTPREHFEDGIETLKPVVNTIAPHLRPDMSVLDVGCGTGELLYSIRPFVREVVGVELNQCFVDFMGKELGIEGYAEDLNLIEFGGRTFNAILCINTLDHLPNPLDTLLTMRRLLKPGGFLYIEVPNQEEALNHYLPEQSRKQYNTFFWHKAHYFYFTDNTLGGLMRKAGFSPEITCRHNYTLKNFLQWYFIGAPQSSYLEATTGNCLFPGNSSFERRMNALFKSMDGAFHEILAETGTGDTLCCLAVKRGRI